ncbi:type IV CRISPR-associated protein Csf2 [Duganella vulcania]|uniref:Type IV CRISPR-associated protein Csf2 n=1 Tax=Duganella vulcania TaxID=2692166 RepID=A0A845GH53_9BURK|nr:type IV CRISPR-associated protein Csf2 [Duganella vulcania]MYM92616.1 type IV CRISPR-associated protein Csf2 [Duganella vulcania]
MTIHNRIEGIFRLTRPMHCASPDESLAKSDDGNVTPTMQMRIVTPNGVQTIPYFPGNDLRGRLRRKAAAQVLDAISVAKKIRLELYVGMNSGAISASPDSAALTVEEVLRARDNVYMGLFGGGARLLRSRYSVADLVPVIEDTIAMGTVPSRFGDLADGGFKASFATDEGLKAMRGYQLVQVTQVLRVDDTLRVLRPDELEKYIGDSSAVANYQTAMLAGTATRKADKAKAKAGEIKKGDISGKVGIGNILAYQSIVAGTPMYFSLDFTDDVTDEHVGLMLLALQALVREQGLGGWVRAGLGKFTADLSLVRHGESMAIFTDKAASQDATFTPAIIEQFIEPATRAIAKLTADEMFEFFKERAGAESEVA